MPSPDRRLLDVVDTHYGGDVSRIVTAGVPRIPGDTVLAKRAWLQDHGDALRRLLLSPPYGEPAMCANVIVDTTIASAQAGYVIMEAMGYPHFSGSNSICVVTALLESGAIPMDPAGAQTVHLEAPAGLIRAEVIHDGTFVESVTLGCDPAWVVARDCSVELPDHGPVNFDLVWSGCFYAVVDAEAHGFALSEPERPALAAFGYELCLVATPELDLVHPDYGDTGPLAFVSFAGPVDHVDGEATSRSATYVHPGVVCRCPTGTGTAARLALAVADGTMAPGDAITTTSPTGSRMVGRVAGVATRDGRTEASSTITGRAFTLARSTLVVNFDDDLAEAEGIWELLGDLGDFK